MAKRNLLVCSGSHCGKKLRKQRDLQERLDRLPVEITRVGCQKICRGPVIGIRVDDELQWFERMSSKKALQALVALVDGKEMRKPLKKRRNEKRMGKLRT